MEDLDKDRSFLVKLRLYIRAKTYIPHDRHVIKAMIDLAQDSIGTQSQSDTFAALGAAIIADNAPIETSEARTVQSSAKIYASNGNPAHSSITKNQPNRSAGHAILKDLKAVVSGNSSNGTEQRLRDVDLEIGGTTNRSKDEINKLIYLIDERNDARHQTGKSPQNHRDDYFGM